MRLNKDFFQEGSTRTSFRKVQQGLLSGRFNKDFFQEGSTRTSFRKVQQILHSQQ
jgi:hypothetical protein